MYLINNRCVLWSLGEHVYMNIVLRSVEVTRDRYGLGFKSPAAAEGI